MQNPQIEIMQLKARLFDANEHTEYLRQILGQIAQRVNFKGERLEELVEQVPEQAPEEDEPKEPE